MIHNGDAILVYNKFDIKDLNTWLSPIVRFFINLFETSRYCKYQHVGVIALSTKDDELHYYDAKNDGYQDRGLAVEFLAKKNPKHWAIARYKGEFSDSKFILANKVLEGTKYDFLNTMFVQLIYQASNDKIWLGAKKDSKRVNCSEAYAHILNIAAKEKVFKMEASITAKDLFTSKEFTIFEYESR